MKKIIIFANRSDTMNELYSLAETLFPECEVNVVSAIGKSNGNKHGKDFHRVRCGDHEGDRFSGKTMCLGGTK